MQMQNGLDKRQDVSAKECCCVFGQDGAKSICIHLTKPL